MRGPEKRKRYRQHVRDEVLAGKVNESTGEWQPWRNSRGTSHASFRASVAGVANHDFQPELYGLPAKTRK